MSREFNFEEMLSKYKEIISDTSSDIYKILDIFSKIAETKENLDLFVEFFSGIDSAEFSLEDATAYIREQGMGLSVEAVTKFLKNFKEILNEKRLNNLYNKIFKSKFDFGVLIDKFQDIYEEEVLTPDRELIEVEIENDPSVASLKNAIGKLVNILITHENFERTFLYVKEGSTFFNKPSDFLFAPIIDYYQEPFYLNEEKTEIIPFRNIRFAEKEYFEKINKFIGSDVLKGSVEKDAPIIDKVSNMIFTNVRYGSNMDWFLIDRPLPIFLRKDKQKPYFHYETDVNNEILFALKRAQHQGITIEELYKFSDDFIKNFKDYLLTILKETTESSTEEKIKNILDREDEDYDVNKSILKNYIITFIKEEIDIFKQENSFILNSFSDVLYLYFLRLVFGFFKDEDYDDYKTEINTALQNKYKEYKKIYTFYFFLKNEFENDKRFVIGGN